MEELLLQVKSGNTSGLSIKSESNFVKNTGGASAYSASQPNYSDPRMQLTQEEFSQLLRPELKPETETLIPGLTLYIPDRGDIDWRLGVCIINESCQRGNIFIEFFIDEGKFVSKGIYEYSCILYIKSIEISKGTGASKKEAKNEAAKNGILRLMDEQPVIYKCDLNHDHLATVQKTQLVRRSYENAAKLDDSNLGNKLLRKMGWKGSGGVGKNETGRADPVFLDAAEGRKGVGHDFKNREIKRSTVEQTLLDFIRNDEQTEIRFSNELSPEERAIVHLKSQQFGLKHKSHGKGEDRYLVVSKRIPNNTT